eukprot:SM000033S12410  [mRNA]  locus=s33:840385:845176:+ [translate_table: standard]
MATANGRPAGDDRLREGADKLRAAGLLKDRNFVGGRWVGADSGETFQVRQRTRRKRRVVGTKPWSLLLHGCPPHVARALALAAQVTDPATGGVVTELPHVGAAETRRAIDAAAEAFPAWAAKTAKERSKILREWYNLIMANKDDLALLMTLEQGKPLKESLAEVEYGAGYIELYSEEAKRVYGDIIPPVKADSRILVIRQPVGVIGAITPWNFPIAMITRKVGPALAVGCTAVVKPAELTPLCTLALVELATRAGVPEGVLNVVTGDSKEIGGAILGSEKVMKITFTGSTAVGKKLMAQAADTVKKVSLELGGNAPLLVFDDADIQLAAKGALATKFRNSGQTCVCANRILVQEGVYDEFVEAFAMLVSDLKVGNGLDEGVTQGPLINEAGIEKVDKHVQDALSKVQGRTLYLSPATGLPDHQGAKAVVGGKHHSLGGLFYEPTVLSNATPDMMICREEVFGPVAPIFRFGNEADGIRMANDTEFGLAAYAFTQDMARAFRVSEALQYGMVGLNDTAISTEMAPFGGVKQSGLGREGSKYGVDEYLEMKYILLGNLTREQK